LPFQIKICNKFTVNQDLIQKYYPMQIVSVREGRKEDIQQVFDLIKELSVYEKLAHEVETTPEQLLNDGFGPDPLYGLLVAEDNENKIVGISLYYFRYSTWKGKRLYIEDIVVTESKRGQGIGRKLFDSTIRKAKELNCNGINWLVLDWNKSAMSFYDIYKPVYDPTWVVASLTGDQVRDFE
jgi:GNAT superfamily N-acetyltransferase